MAKVFLRAYNREIETMIDRGQLNEAVAHCHHILKTHPKHLETYRLLGKAYLEDKRHGDAADLFSRVIVSVPNDFVAQVGMSIIRDEENKLDDAIWHMERAFETQPSNSAIQSELQRLYGRRDGVQPPRIRMTRGALANMYVQGELYPQAISEIKSVLKEDPGRSDMQALLARAYYKSGLKNDAADVATALLRRYPYALDANRVLAEILGTDRPENAQVYRQRVVELDPYAAQVIDTLFQSNDVPDAAVSLERLDWNGQPVGPQTDWGETGAIRLDESTPSNEQPEWLSGSFNQTPPPPLSQPISASIFDTPAQPEPTPAQPAEDIPDFLRKAGWGQSTGTFDESTSMFADEEAAPSQSLEVSDLPDWVKAMKPAEPAAQEEADEELPDWINQIGAGALSSHASDDQPDWLKPSETPSEPFASTTDEQPDWLKSLDARADATVPAAQSEDPGWLQGLGSEPEATAPDAQSEDLGWLQGPGSETEAITPPAEQPEELDWLKDLGNEPAAAPATAQTDEPGWPDPFDAETESTPSAASPADLDFLDQLTEEPILGTPAEPAAASTSGDNLGVTEQERDDSFAWLEALAAKQGASEGLLTKPEERLHEEPDWVKQARGLSTAQPPASVEPPTTPPAVQPDDLGKSEQERDDSFAWLENLAAKQGASEGLLTQPEDRLEQEPEWVRQAKDLNVPQPPPITPPSSIEELGKSEQERDDSFAWLENLAARQGASEGLLTKPEERLEEEPEWVRQAKDLGAQQPPVSVTPQVEPEQTDDTNSWLQSLETPETAPEPTPAKDEVETWLENLEGTDTSTPVEDVQPAQTSMPDWMNEIGRDEIPAAESAIDEQKTGQGSEWVFPTEEEPVASTEKASDEPSLPSWLKELDQEEPAIQSAGDDDDLPAWLRGEETAPQAAEPTRATDWKPVEEQQPKIIYSPPLEEEMVQPEPVSEREPLPSLSEIFDIPVEKPEQVQEQPKPEPYKEPVATRRGTGGLATPGVDPLLGLGRNELSRSNISAALESYGRLIKKGRFLDEVIYDLRDALYRYPVDVSIWQALGDAYMRANRLQDALDAYTKAEELLR